MIFFAPNTDHVHGIYMGGIMNTKNESGRQNIECPGCGRGLLTFMALTLVGDQLLQGIQEADFY